LECEALAAQDASATTFLNHRIKTSTSVAAWREIRSRQPVAVGPSPTLLDPARLADPTDHISLGLHTSTIRPDRLRSFVQALDRSVTQTWTKNNSKAVVSAVEWERAYGSSPVGARSWYGDQRRSRMSYRRQHAAARGAASVDDRSRNPPTGGRGAPPALRQGGNMWRAAPRGAASSGEAPHPPRVT
jgi:hypothetical protein